jgi:AbrB family looped-hinge helix DNA binding protein
LINYDHQNRKVKRIGERPPSIAIIQSIQRIEHEPLQGSAGPDGQSMSRTSRVWQDLGHGNSHLASRTMLSTVSEKGQITIPKRLRERLGIRAGDRLELPEKEGQIIARKAVTDDQ